MTTYHIHREPHSKVSAYMIFFLAASFYLYEFILQVAPSVMAAPMMQTFRVSAEGFGVISAFYFYAYAPMQLPAGLLFDRYGPRKLMTGALILWAQLFHLLVCWFWFRVGFHHNILQFLQG